MNLGKKVREKIIIKDCTDNQYFDKETCHGNEAFAYEARLYEKIAVVRWIALVPHGQRVMGSNPITVIGGVRWGI